ncbi:MAG: hypothetical protein IPK60_22320 [Sandaracinaceae bacterium]|jgi:hypothetical protein|nr:hypothetical protein [Sandaracinaceae bacterium]
MSAKVEFERGESGEVSSWDGSTMTVLASGPYAPGAPTRMKIHLETTAVDVEARAKDSKRVADGRFQVRLRVINLRREQLELLATLST